MDRKKLFLLIAALVVALGTALAARSLFAGAASPTAGAVQAPQPQGPRVLVARRALPAGTILTADAVDFQLWPQGMVQDVYYIDGETDMTRLLGTVVRHPVTAGEPVTRGALVAPGDRGFLAAALGPGMRAVTVEVSARTGVAGFVFPGDRVDIMLTQTVEGDGPPLKATETILRNLRVLATDQSTETTAGEDGKTLVREFRTVTLEVTPKIAEKIAVAQTIGTLGLSLRSIADSHTDLDRAIATGEIDRPDNASPEEEARLLRSATAQPQDGSSSFVTGGDVSRFQRTSMPRQARAASAMPAPVPQQTIVTTTQSGDPQSAARSGPTVLVTRGKTTSIVSVGR